MFNPSLFDLIWCRLVSIFGLWAVNLTNRCMKLTLVLLKVKSFSLFSFPRKPVVFHLPYPFLNVSAVEIFIFQHILALSVVFFEPVSIKFSSFFKSLVCDIFEGCFKLFPGIGKNRKFISKITLKIIDLFRCHCYPGFYRWLLSFPFPFQGEGAITNDQPVVGETISFYICFDNVNC